MRWIVRGDGGGERRGDVGVEFAPRELGRGVALGGFLDLAVRIELLAMEMARDEMGAVAGAREQLVGDGARELLRVHIHVGHALLAIGQRIGA